MSTIQPGSFGQAALISYHNSISGEGPKNSDYSKALLCKRTILLLSKELRTYIKKIDAEIAVMDRQITRDGRKYPTFSSEIEFTNTLEEPSGLFLALLKQVEVIESVTMILDQLQEHLKCMKPSNYVRGPLGLNRKVNKAQQTEEVKEVLAGSKVLGVLQKDILNDPSTSSKQKGKAIQISGKKSHEGKKLFYCNFKINYFQKQLLVDVFNRLISEESSENQYFSVLRFEKGQVERLNRNKLKIDQASDTEDLIVSLKRVRSQENSSPIVGEGKIPKVILKVNEPTPKTPKIVLKAQSQVEKMELSPRIIFTAPKKPT